MSFMRLKAYRFVTVFPLFSLLVAGFLFIATPGVGQASAATYRMHGHVKPRLPLLSSHGAASATQTFTHSRYITRKDVAHPARLNTDGCNQAHSGANDIVMLDFGETIQNGSIYGTYLPGTTSPFVSGSTIQALVERYLTGYGLCDLTGAVLMLGIGTTNQGFGTDADATSAGEEWATMVTNVNSWIANQSFSSQEAAVGGSDMESGFNSAEISRAWADGYDNVSYYTGVAYFNYGNAAGCPTTDNGSIDQSCANGWYQGDIAYVSWDAFAAFPLPQIYATSGADALAWQSIEYYQRNNPGPYGGMAIFGAFTQYKACQQTGSCSGTNNTPAAGWNQLTNALNSSSVTAQSLSYLTDVQWDY